MPEDYKISHDVDSPPSINDDLKGNIKYWRKKGIIDPKKTAELLKLSENPDPDIQSQVFEYVLSIETRESHITQLQRMGEITETEIKDLRQKDPREAADYLKNKVAIETEILQQKNQGYLTPENEKKVRSLPQEEALLWLRVNDNINLQVKLGMLQKDDPSLLWKLDLNKALAFLSINYAKKTKRIEEREKREADEILKKL